MKALLITILSAIFFTTASATNFDGIKISTAGKSTLEANYTSTSSTKATVTITNEAGNVVNTKTVTLIKGNNSILLLDVATLNEGTFTVTIVAGKETAETKFVNFKLD